MVLFGSEFSLLGCLSWLGTDRARLVLSSGVYSQPSHAPKYKRNQL